MDEVKKKKPKKNQKIKNWCSLVIGELILYFFFIQPNREEKNHKKLLSFSHNQGISETKLVEHNPIIVRVWPRTELLFNEHNIKVRKLCLKLLNKCIFQYVNPMNKWWKSRKYYCFVSVE